jgi:origin recognition complex subunit 1
MFVVFIALYRCRVDTNTCQETNPFTYVEINGLRIPEPTAAYSLLWEAVSGHDVTKEGHLRIGAKESLKLLTTHFSGGGGRGPGGHAWSVKHVCINFFQY